MRKAAGYLAILMSVSLLFLATAGASPAWAWNNAAIAIVKDSGNGSSICTFHIHGTAWDSRGTGTWDVALASGGSFKASGTWTADTSGTWNSSTVTTLANGNYRVHAMQKTPVAGGDRYLSLTVNCGTSGTTTGTSTSTTTGTGTSTTTATST